MDNTDPQFRTKRSLKIAILGAPRVGKTSIALRFVTNETVVETSPTTIEDNYRKEDRFTISDDVGLKRLMEHLTDAESEDEILLEEEFGFSASKLASTFGTIDIGMTMKITDTAGYKIAPKSEGYSSRKLFSRLTMRKKHGLHHVTLVDKQKSDKQSQTQATRSNSCDEKAKERLDNCLSQCDGVILVYSVLEEASFTAACELRNRLFQIRSNMAKKESAMKPKSSIFAQLHQFCCGNAVEQDVKVPPLYLVGTHADVRVEKMLHEKSSRNYDLNFLHSEENKPARGPMKKRKVGKTLTSGRSSIQPHDVFPVISEWKECTGFAEITKSDFSLVKEIFQKLSLAIVVPPA